MSLAFPLKSILIHSLLILVIAVLLNLVYHQLVPSFHNGDEGGRLVSHVVCTGHNHTERRCRFRNLCYKADTKEFVLIVGHNSVVSGVPSDRFRPALADVSSINDHNRYYFNYVQVLTQSFHQMRHQYDLIYMREDTIIFGRFKPDNLMHLLHDDIFPLYATMKQLTVMHDVQQMRIFFFDEWNDTFDTPTIQYAKSIYHKLIPAKSFLTGNQLSKNQLVCFRNAHVGVNKETTWYDYGFREPQRALPAHGQEVMLRKTVDAIIDDLGLGDRDCDVRRVILISRRINRLILNEVQLLKIISIHSNYELPVVSLRLEGFTNFTDLVRSIRCAKVLIGVHGSGLVLSAFLPHDAALIEIFPFAINADHYTPYKTLCQLLAIKYSSWTNRERENSVTHADFPASLGGINHLPPNKIKEITSASEVKRHLCCSNPEWLFRIYQDTIVDVDSFSPVFASVWHEVNQRTVNQRKRRGVDAAPGAVMLPVCRRNGTDAEIAWTEPWNLDMIGLTVEDRQTIKYEVVVQGKGRNEREAIVTKSPILRITLSGSQNLIWIRCFVNTVAGPFTPEPLYC